MELIKFTKLFAICSAVFLAIFLLLQQIAGFSIKQSICLAIVALLCMILGIYGGASGASDRDAVAHDPEANWGRVAADFTPHQICASPKWPEILLNYQLLTPADETEFRQLFENEKFNNQISLTVLQCKWGSDRPGLILANKAFQTGVEFWEFVPKFGLDTYRKECIGLPRLGLRMVEQFHLSKPPEATMFELSLELSQRWWKKLCATGVRIPPLEVRPDGAAVDVNLILARLPFSELLGYYDPFGIRRYGGNRSKIVESRLKSLPRGATEIERFKALTDSSGVWEKIRDRELEENGWKRNDSRDDDDTIHPCVEHRFFTVTHCPI